MIPPRERRQMSGRDGTIQIARSSSPSADSSLPETHTDIADTHTERERKRERERSVRPR